MSYILFSASCYIKGNPYNIHISIDEKYFVSTPENVVLITDHAQLKSNSVDNPNLILVEFKLLNDEKVNPINKSVDTIPKIICLNQLVNVKRIDSLSNESIEMKINYVQISESFLWTLEGIEVEIDLISGNELYLILN
jgi:hypothetical protein